MRLFHSLFSPKLAPKLPPLPPKLPPLPPLYGSRSDAIRKYLLESYYSEHAHWVIPGHVIQGQHPVRGKGPMSGRIHDIVERGQCTTFVCLQAESSPQSNTNRRGKETTVLGGLNDWEINPINFEPYRPEVETAISEVSVRTPSFLHYGIRDMSPADDMDEFAGFVKALSSRVINGETLYLHCWGGKGRAGLVAACLLGTLYEQVDAEEALHRVGMYCQSRHSGVGHYLHSPETNEQREQVRQFYKSLREEK
jgi:protein-tyrosine phosphatase